MRTLSTQVRLRRLIRAFSEAVDRLVSEPAERQMIGPVTSRLLELAAAVRDSWRRERLTGSPGAALDAYVRDALSKVEFAIAAVPQPGADLQLLGRDFEAAALPLEVFLRGLDGEQALQRSA